MNNLRECVDEYTKNGYTRDYAISKVCQDIIINRIYNSEYSDKITIKGGVVMFHLTKNVRRATIDMDLDLINMSIATESIVNIFTRLGSINRIDNFKLGIDKEKIETLSHQDYHGKRLNVIISDNFGNKYCIKLDVGVHKNTEILQDTLILDTKIIEGKVCFLANPKEQIFVEKLLPVLKFGVLSTRYRDVFDIYWLIVEGNLNKTLILEYMKLLIFDTDIEVNNVKDVLVIINLVLTNNIFIQNLSNNNNWTGQKLPHILNTIKDYILEISEYNCIS